MCKAIKAVLRVGFDRKVKLIKIGAKVVNGGRYVRFQMSDVAISRRMFAQILRNIAKPRAPPAWA